MAKQSWLRKKFVEAGSKIPKSESLRGSFTTKGAGKRFARNIVKQTGYEMPKTLKVKPKPKKKKKKGKRTIKKVIIYN